MNTKTAPLPPANAFKLTEIGRESTDDGTEWVAYTDGTYIDLVTFEEWTEPTTETDYSRWCAGTSTPSPKIYRELMRATTNNTVWQTSAHGTVRLPEMIEVESHGAYPTDALVLRWHLCVADAPEEAPEEDTVIEPHGASNTECADAAMHYLAERARGEDARGYIFRVDGDDTSTTLYRVMDDGWRTP